MVYDTVALLELDGSVAVVPVGAENVGSVLSVTVTLNVVVASLPLESAAVHVTSVSPTSKSLPDGGVQTGVTSSPELSAATTT